MLTLITKLFHKMNNETFVKRVVKYYTIDDYVNYAVIYFKNNKLNA